MKFFKGKVESSTKDGVSVTLANRVPYRNVTVNMMSPFYDANNGGMFTPPAPGAEILFAFDEELGESFYLGTIVGKSILNPGSDDNQKKDTVNERFAFNSDSFATMMTFTNSDGAGLKVTNFIDGPEKQMIKNVVLKTSQGHKVELNESPTVDRVMLQNKHQEGMTITAESPDKEKRSIEIKTLNSIRTTASLGEIATELTDGRDITIKNRATGDAGGPLIPSPFGGFTRPIPAGNLNLVTTYKDINIYTEELPNAGIGDAGRILISTPQGVIQLKSGSGGLNIYSEGNVTITSAKVPKIVTITSLGENPITRVPNITGDITWVAVVGQPVRSGDILANVTSPTGGVIPITSPFNGTLSQQLITQGPVTIFAPIAVILTGDGDITVEAANNLNLKAANQVNIQSNFGINVESLAGPIVVETPLTMNLNSGLGTKVQSALDVTVAGASFTMGTAASNILPTNGGGSIYAPKPTPAEPIIPPPPVAITTIPERGAYILAKQP
jgi:hypothetical protein